MKSRVLVLGAGFGGMELATLLSDQLGAEADVTIIERADGFVFGFAKFDVMFGKASAADVTLPYRSFLKPGVRWVKDTITAIDPVRRRVTTQGGSYEGDVLVLALGAEFDIAATPGLAEAGQEFYSVPGAARLGQVLPGFTRGTAIVGVCGFPYKCPPAPSECVLTLHHYLKARGYRQDCELILVSPLSSPMPASAELSAALMQAFAEAGIRVVLNRSVAALDPARRVAVLDDGMEMTFDLFLGVPRHRAPQVVIDAGLTEGGWVPIDLKTMATSFPNVYAIGDLAKTGLPKAGSFAESQAKAVASAILAQVRGGAPSFNTGQGSCLVEFGDGRIGWADLDFLTGPRMQSVFHAPSLEGRAHKDRFGASRAARWFGPNG